jgi:hypothetical protein
VNSVFHLKQELKKKFFCLELQVISLDCTGTNSESGTSSESSTRASTGTGATPDVCSGTGTGAENLYWVKINARVVNYSANFFVTHFQRVKFTF